MKATKLITIFCLILISSVGVRGQEWRKIEPLRSTRADVERMLGKPEKDWPTNSIYKFKNGNALIWYSSKPCEGPSGGWRVPPGTVIQISFSYSDSQPRFSDLKLDRSKYERVSEGDYLDFMRYRNNEEGISYSVNEPKGLVSLVTYYPAARDDYLRCPAPPPNPDDGIEYSRKFEAYSNIPIEEQKRRLEDFAAQLLNYEPDARGYIIAYAGPQADEREVSRLARCAGDYIVKTLGINEERVAIKFGGQREEFEIELWIRPNGYRAPESAMGKPDIKAIQVDRVKRRGQRNCVF